MCGGGGGVTVRSKFDVQCLPIYGELDEPLEVSIALTHHALSRNKEKVGPYHGKVLLYFYQHFISIFSEK